MYSISFETMCGSEKSFSFQNIIQINNFQPETMFIHSKIRYVNLHFVHINVNTTEKSCVRPEEFYVMN